MRDLARSRQSVSAVFFANGLFVGCWAVLIPVVIRNLDITESEMGLIILAGGLAAILALVLSAKLINLFGARTIIIIAALGLAPGLFAMLQVQSIMPAVIILLFIMAFLACQDVAMNANAADLEARSEKPVMSAFHGFWSAGAMTGAFSGGSLILLLGSNGFSLLAGAVTLFAAVTGYRNLERKSTTAISGEVTPGYLPTGILPWLFGLIAFVGFVSEGAVIDWSAQFLRTELDSGVQLSGFAFGGFSLSMMIARFFGDHLRQRTGDKNLFIGSVLVAGTGFTLVIFSSSAALAATGFFLAGFGNANIVPIAFSAAARIPGLPRGMGIATASFCGYTGLLVAPATLGYVGEHFGFRLVFASMGLMILALLMLAPVVARQNRVSGRTA